MHYSSFVIRLWQREDEGNTASEIYGRIEHVQSSATGAVECLDDVAAFIRPYLEKQSENNEENRPEETII